MTPRYLGGLGRLAAAVAMLAMAAAIAPRAIAQEPQQGMGAAPEQRGHIEIADPPLVMVQASPPYGNAPLLVGFLLNATDPASRGIVSFSWNFGDGHFSVASPLLAYNTYQRPGNYVVTVTVTTADGRSATGFTGVIVKPGPASGAQANP